MSQRVLFLLDCETIVGAAEDMFSHRSRVDFKILKDIAFRDADVGKSFSVAFINLDSPWVQELATVLKKLNYEIESYGPKMFNESLVSVSMTVTAMANYSKYDRIVVASGRGDLVPLYKFLKNTKVEVEAMGFPHTMSNYISSYLTNEVELDESVLFHKKDKPASEESVEFKGVFSVPEDIKTEVSTVV